MKTILRGLGDRDREILTRCSNDIGLWVKGYFNGQVFPYQRYFYHAPQKDKLLIAGIRTGKSRLVSMGFLHFAQYHPYSRLLNTSISSEQAKIVFTNCLEYCNHPNFSHWIEHVQSSPYPMIRLVNGSEIWFKPLGFEAELIRGFEFDFICVDEGAYVQRELAIKTLKGRLLGYNTMINAYRAGIFWIVSSPRPQPWLIERWKKGDPAFPNQAQLREYLSLRATIWHNPMINREEIQRLMNDYTEAMIRQELYGEFIINTSAVFPYHLVMAMTDENRYEVRWLYDQIKFWNARMAAQHDAQRAATGLAPGMSVRAAAGLTEDITHYECDPESGHRYVNSWDLGSKPRKNGRNAMVGMVLDVTHEPWRLVAYYYREGMGYVEAMGQIEMWHKKYSNLGTALCKTVIDGTGKGDVLREFMEANRVIEDLEAIVYTGQNKPDLIIAGKFALEHGQVVMPFIKEVVNQLTNYEIFDEKLAQDTVMAFCQACYVARDIMRLGFGDSTGYTLQQQLNNRATYTHRTPQVRLNSRYTEKRMAARTQGRQQTRQQQQGGARGRPTRRAG